MTKIEVSPEVQTFMIDLYNQIEYELREDYKDGLQEALDRIDKAIKTLKDTSVDMPSTLLMETIDYAIHQLKGEENE